MRAWISLTSRNLLATMTRTRGLEPGEVMGEPLARPSEGSASRSSVFGWASGHGTC
jgi:hypothetical protein